MTVMLFLVKTNMVKKKIWDGALSWRNSRCEVFTYFPTVAIKSHSSMRNSLSGLPGQILCEQSPWYQRKWWACFWLCSSPASPFLASVSLDFHCTANTFTARGDTSSQIFTKSGAVPLPDPSQNRIRPDTWLQIKGHKKISTSTQLREILYTDSQDMLVLSYIIARCYWSCCTDRSTSPGNYGYPFLHIKFHKDKFRHLGVVRRGDTHTSTQNSKVIGWVYIHFFQDKESRLKKNKCKNINCLSLQFTKLQLARDYYICLKHFSRWWKNWKLRFHTNSVPWYALHYD
jgi:hypothetical protein